MRVKGVYSAAQVGKRTSAPCSRRAAVPQSRCSETDSNSDCLCPWCRSALQSQGSCCVRTKELLVVGAHQFTVRLTKKPLSCGSCRLVAQFDSNSKGTAGPGRASCRSRLQKMSGGVECRRPSSSVATECISTRILPWNQHLGGILVRAGPCTCSDRQIEPGMPSRRC